MGAMSIQSLRSSANPASGILKAAGNPQRLRILCDLSDGELSVGQLEAKLDLSQSALSQHLARLRKARLVCTRRDRQTIYYSLDGRAAPALLAMLSSLYAARPAALVDGAFEGRAEAR